MAEPVLHEAVVHGLAAPGKSRNGDFGEVREVDEGKVVLLAIADGVTTRPSDWMASQTACEAALATFTAAAGSYADRLHAAVTHAHEAVASLEGGHKGAICTLVLVAWERGQDEFHYVNVGDSRLHVVSDEAVTCLTKDDAQDTVVTRDGELVLEAGAVRTTRGITSAVGMETQPRIEVQTAAFAPGGMLALTTDGCHTLPGFATRLVEVFARPDLAAAIQHELFVNWPADDQDDATIVALRRGRFTNGLRVKAAATLEADRDPVQAGVPRHMMARHVVDHMRALLEAGDPSRLGPVLDYVQRHGLRPGRARLLTVLDSFVDDGRPETKKLFDRLVAVAREA